MKDILFINVPSAFTAYQGTKLNAGLQLYPLLCYASLGAVLKGQGLGVAVLDMGIEGEPYKVLDKTLEELKPRVVGFTSTTPLYAEVKEISKIVRKKLGRNVRIVYGGPHATALPEDSLRETDVDIVVCAEGEETLTEIMTGKPLSDVKGIYYKDNGHILSTPPRSRIRDLDTLPFPALDLYDVKRYKCPTFLSRGSPTANMETSRGCPCNCTFCNKNISGLPFRKKSPERVVEEMKYMLRMGVGEIRIIDDQFGTDMERAKLICEKIIQSGLKFPWNLGNGVRADRVDEEFLILAKKAGCYQIGIGFESGDQASLDGVHKGIKLEESIRCMELVRKVGLESVGFFMLGLPDDTEESLKRTIDFAVNLMPDYAKVTITVPFPGTTMFEEYEKRGLIKSRDWTQYNLHRAGEIYTHPHLSYETLKHYYNLFYWKYYLHPRFLTRKIAKSYSEGTLLRNFYYGLQTFFPRIFPVSLPNGRSSSSFSRNGEEDSVKSNGSSSIMKLQHLYAGLQILRANFLDNVKVPISVYIALTDRCPNACRYCNYENLEKKGTLTTEEVKGIIDEMHAMGGRRLHLTGGEPLLRNDIGEIVRYGKSKGLFMGISTSGFLVPKRIKDIKDADIVFLSLDGEPEVHDFLRGSGGHEMVMEAMDCLKREGTRYWTTTVLTNKNLHSTDYLIDMAEAHGYYCNFVLLYHEDDTVNNIPSARSIRDLIPTREQYKQVLTHLLDKKRSGYPVGSSPGYLKFLLDWEDYIEIYKSRRFPGLKCWAGKLCCTITSDGLVYACGPAIGRMEGKDVKTLGFEKAFKSSEPIPNCNACIHACWLESNLLFSLNFGSIMNWASKFTEPRRRQAVH